MKEIPKAIKKKMKMMTELSYFNDTQRLSEKQKIKKNYVTLSYNFSTYNYGSKSLKVGKQLQQINGNNHQSLRMRYTSLTHIIIYSRKLSNML